MRPQTALLLLAACAALALAVVLAWRSGAADPGRAPLVRAPDAVELPPGEGARGDEAAGRQRAEPAAAGTVDPARPDPPGGAGSGRAPTERALQEQPAAAGVVRVHGQVDLLPGTPAPPRYEVWIERDGAARRALELAGDQRAVAVDLEPGRSTLSARAEGLVSQPRVVDVAGDAAVAPFRLVLEPAAGVVGRVLDARGEPLAELDVLLIVPGQPGARTARTDAEGRYRFDALPSGSYRVALGSAEHPIAPLAPVEATPETVREVPTATLPELGEAAVSVVDGAGAPVAGASVLGPGQRGGAIAGTTGADGALLARFLPAGTYTLEVVAPDGRAGRASLVVEPGRRAEVQVRL